MTLFNKNILRKILSYLILCTILVYGILRFRVLAVFAPIVKYILELFSVDIHQLTVFLNQVTRQTKWNENVIGWGIYYPTYFLLHITFIWIIYHDRPKAKKYLSLALTVLIGFLLLSILISKLVELAELYILFVKMFRSLFGLPFILLAIEGGRILYDDIEKLSKKDT